MFTTLAAVADLWSSKKNKFGNLWSINVISSYFFNCWDEKTSERRGKVLHSSTNTKKVLHRLFIFEHSNFKKHRIEKLKLRETLIQQCVGLIYNKICWSWINKNKHGSTAQWILYFTFRFLSFFLSLQFSTIRSIVYALSI